MQSIRAPLSRAEFPAKVLVAGSRTKSSSEDVSLDIPRQCCLNNLDLLPMNDRVGRVDDDLVVRLEAGDDFYCVAVIVARSYRCAHQLSLKLASGKLR